MTSSSEWVKGPLDVSFYTKTWKPTGEVKAAVTFVHGFVEHVDRYDHVFEKFAEEGIFVFGFDQRGFGQTGAKTKSLGVTSWQQAFSDISFFIAHTASLVPPSTPVFLVGHSMGGALALGYATRVPKPEGLSRVKGVVSSSPLLRQAKGVKASSLLVRAGSLLGKVSNKLTIKAEVKPEDICRDPAVQEAYRNDPLCEPIGTYRGVADMLLGGEQVVSKDYARWPPTLPVLCVHGTDDKVTDHDASKEFVEKLRKMGVDATFESFPGYYHEMHNEPDDLKWKEIAVLTGWIKSKL